jgi:hypothetical protein
MSGSAASRRTASSSPPASPGCLSPMDTLQR